MHHPSRFQIKVAEQIIDQAIMNNKPHYLIKWKYLSHEYDTWQSLQNLQQIVCMLQKWIRTKRESRQSSIMNNVASYCDTVNYVNPMKKVRRKRKIVQKSKQSRAQNNQVVVLDDEDDQQIEKINFTKQQQNQFDYDQSSQIIEEEEQKRDDANGPNKWGVNTRSTKIESIEEEIQKNAYALNFDPQKTEQNPQPESKNLKAGMKVIGRVRSEDIENILEHFVFKETLCFKIELNDGRITNMRDDDLKKLCPQMLMEYYEYNGIKI